MGRIISETAETQDSDASVMYYCQADYGQIFWSNGGEVIKGIHENDGEYRHEYMKGLFAHFGIKVEYVSDIPEFVREWGGEDYFSNDTDEDNVI